MNQIKKKDRDEVLDCRAIFLTTAFAAAAQDLTEGLVGYYGFPQ
ncbi:MAG: hypothetical protein NXI25_10190 [bacterium]|nr:hypothetical protein [bacterium]